MQCNLRIQGACHLKAIGSFERKGWQFPLEGKKGVLLQSNDRLTILSRGSNTLEHQRRTATWSTLLLPKIAWPSGGIQFNSNNT